MLGVRNPLSFPSCVYVWVMNHLRVVSVMLLDYFRVFGWISGKRDEISKFGQFRGLTSWCRDPTQRRGREGGLDKPWVRRGVAKLRRGVALFIDMCFCRVLIFSYSEDPISV